VVDLKDLGAKHKIVLNFASDVRDSEVTFYYAFSGSGYGPERKMSTGKSNDQPVIPLDNKHGGAKKKEEGGGFGGAGSSGSWVRFTTDNAPGYGAVYVYPDEGGPLVALAKGAPLERPISAQLNQTATKLWIMDQANASMFVVPFPCLPDCWERIFPREYPQWPWPPIASNPH